MSFKWAYCAFTLALVIAACGKKEEPASSETSSQPAAAETAAPLTGEPFKDYTTGITKIADAFANVKDEASAKAAAAEIHKINEQLTPLADKLKSMTDAEKAQAAMASAGDLILAQQKIAAAGANLAMTKPELMEIISQELDKMPDID